MSERLTKDFLETLKPTELIYAEFATPGAMGNAGGVMFYVYKNNKLELYETNCYESEDEFSKSFLFLKQVKNELVELDGGFGNTVYARIGSRLKVDKEHGCFVYEHNGKIYDIYTSVAGVYNHVYDVIEEVTSLAKKDWNKYKKLNEKLISSEYLVIKVSDYKQALSYIRYKNWAGYSYPEEYLAQGKWSLFKYHMRYAEDKLGRIKFVMAVGETLVRNCVKGLGAADMAAGMEEVYSILEKILLENLREKFYDFMPVEWKSDDFNGLFRYPQLVIFSEKAEKALVERIMHEEWFSPYIVGCYFRNYFEQLERLPLDKVLPVVLHVMQNENVISETFAAAGDLLNQAQIFAPDDGEFEKTIYAAVKPKVDAWPVEHYLEIEYRIPGKQEIFEDTLGWLGYMKTLSKIDRRLDRAMKDWRADHAHDLSWWRLVSPMTIGETEKVCKELLDGKIENLPSAAERLLLNHSPKEVKLYILKFYVENYNKIAELFSGVPDMMQSLYEAACEGATHNEEVPVLKKFAKKVVDIPVGSEYVIERNIRIAKLQTKVMKNWKG